ncbi:HxlR family transcriptional regulator [Saccharopolyspora erythraea NRRL 2338]|uniref:Transcriptional regulator, HxlR family n=2 Tax=Saccharopolyspora erythraea TaxID=1836 RepID=A4F7X8_SACEN|nr:helix-turn-helix domain-containing protein [Saccharopolyspora erythraea]EQD85134.1 HxlR family transcriptional regulator [Saccharopolyspora erythraea D]PFG93949.1 HxlR family transcriptional regulator [Saccharopolyspora erythraea NRRL 2338]CAM00152.1 transcriptional regulator, HxlR family [Saccharopolyspora erythraea NRRL 2338]
MVTKDGTDGAPLVADVMDPRCPTRVVLDRIGDRWTTLVVLFLESGPLRFTALRNAIGGVAPKVLTQTLRAMERDGLLTRTVHAQVPPRVDYELTALGRSLLEPIHAVTAWAERHVTEVLDARDRYDETAAAQP